MIARFLLIPLIAATAAAASFTSDEAVNHALRHNPELRALRHEIAEAEGRLMHAGRLANPELEVGVRPNVEGREFSAGVDIVQKFPLTSRLRLEKEVSGAEVEVARHEVREAEQVLAAQVRALAVKCQDVQARRALQRRRADHSRELSAATARAAAAGEASPLAVAEFEFESAEVETRLLALDAEELALTGALRPLLGVGSGEPLAIKGELADPKLAAATSDAAVTARAGIQAAEARLEAARRNVELQRASKWEDMTVGIGYERENVEDAGYGLRRENIVGLRVSIPLPLGKNNLSHIREAEATALRREAESVAVASALQADADAARAEMTASARLFEQASGPLLRQARSLEERYLAAYQSGQAPLTDVLRSREKRFALEAMVLEARRDFNLARVRFDSARGR